MSYFLRYLTTGSNRRQMTVAFWIKRNRTNSGGIKGILGNGSTNTFIRFNDDGTGDEFRFYHPDGSIYWPLALRDTCNWYHFVMSVNTGANGNSGDERVKLYVNGVQYTETRSYTPPALNSDINWSSEDHTMVLNGTGPNSQRGNHQMCDFFYVDGQTLSPDVFGYFKDGEGYTTAGNQNEAKKISGIWKPKPPRAIKKIIEEGGGFGPAGWYLPLNEPYTKGMDFHTTPDTILKINDHLPQPKGGLRDGKIEVREDPLKEHLALAVPFVHSGLENGMGDYSHIIRGDGSAPMTMVNSGATIEQANITNSGRKNSAFYGSALESGDGAAVKFVKYGPSDKFDFDGDDWTIEAWFWPANDQTGNARLFGIGANNTSNAFDCYLDGSISNAARTGSIKYSGSTHHGGPGLPTQQWNHVAIVMRRGFLYTIVNGICQQRVDVDSINTWGTNDKYLQVGMIGEDYVQNQYCFQGYIQDLRVYNCAKYSGGFDCPKIFMDHDFAAFSAVSASTPRNTFATWNYLNNDNTSVSISGWWYGATDITWGTESAYEQLLSTIGLSSGKWYYEIRFHVAEVSFGVVGSYGVGPTLRMDSGRIYLGGTQLQGSLTGHAAGQVYGLAFDVDAKTVQFYLNGATFGTQHTWSSQSQIEGFFMFPMVMKQNSGINGRSQTNFGDNPTFGGRFGLTDSTFKDASGYGTFRYQPPEGYNAICTANLPDPPLKDPSKYFSITRYRGNGNVGRKVTTGLDPALVIIKPLNFNDHWIITGSAMGPHLYNYFTNIDWGNDPNGNNGRVFSHDRDGFSLGTWNNINDPDDTYISYSWKGGGNSHKHNKDGVGSSNASGIELHASQGDWTITPNASSINTTSGFAAIEYTGTAGGSVPHGLGVAPQWLFIKGKNTDHWFAYHSYRDGTEHYYMNNNNSSPGSGIITTPTNTHIQLSNDGGVCGSGTRYAMFAWAQIDGYSRMGKYIGNGNADGPFVYCGFRPAMVFVTSTDNTGSWTMFDNMRDPYNQMDNYIHFNETQGNGSYSGLKMDFTSNGFKVRMTHNHMNGSGHDYQFVAFAESHVKYANAR